MWICQSDEHVKWLKMCISLCILKRLFKNKVVNRYLRCDRFVYENYYCCFDHIWIKMWAARVWNEKGSVTWAKASACIFSVNMILWLYLLFSDLNVHVDHYDKNKLKWSSSPAGLTCTRVQTSLLSSLPPDCVWTNRLKQKKKIQFLLKKQHHCEELWCQELRGP